jgi:outer membrane protein assembly factor BamB
MPDDLQQNSRKLGRRAWLFVPLFVLAGAAAAQWPTTNGNSQHNGLSRYYGPDSARVRWENMGAPAWFGGPIFVEGNRLVTMRFNGLGNTPLVCYDLESGDESWRVDFAGNAARGLPIGFRDHQVYAVNFSESQHDTLYALNPDDGSILWTSPQRVHVGIIFSAVFAADGDLIVPGDNYRMVRINHLTGDTVWTRQRWLPVVGGSEHLVVNGEKVYGWQGTITTPKELTAWDIETGAELYHIVLPGDGDEEIPLTCGPSGTIYAQRDGGLFYALQDNGAGFDILWSVPVEGTPVWGHFGIGADGGVLVPDGTELVKLNSATGDELHRSVPLVTGQWFAPRFAIGADSIIYMGNGASDDGAFYALSPDLDVLWSVSVPNITYSGPAFGPNGEIIIGGSGSQLTAFEGRGAAGSPPSAFDLLSPADGDTVQSDTIFFAWQASQVPDSGDMVEYEMHFTIHRHDGTSHQVTVNALSDTTLAVAWRDLLEENEGEFWFLAVDWNVRAFSEDGATFSNQTWTFHTIPTTAANHPRGTLPGEFAIAAVYPNPFNAEASIQLQLPTDGRLRVALYDVLGRRVMSVADGEAIRGTRILRLNGREMGSGTYILRAEMGSATAIYRIVSLK